MRSLYLLEKAPVTSRARARRTCRVAANVACRCVIVLGFIGLVGAPGGLECGTLSVLEWLIAEVASVALMAAGWIGELATHVDLPLDGGEEGECGSGEG